MGPARTTDTGSGVGPRRVGSSPGEILDSAVRLVSRIPSWVWVALTVAGLALAVLGGMLLRERRRTVQATRDALRDPLTGLNNRLAFEHRLAIDWERARRYEHPLGLLVIDLDGFKEVNDTYGHPAGDRALRDAGAVIAGHVRHSDMAARLGGDEFVVLSVETLAEGLEVLAARLERALGEQAGVAASVGWAQRDPDDHHATDLIDRADVAMYERKRQRRGLPQAPGSAERAQEAVAGG